MADTIMMMIVVACTVAAGVVFITACYWCYANMMYDLRNPDRPRPD